MKFRQGQGLSINTIVVMAVALIVLAVLIFLVYRFVAKPGQHAGDVLQCSKQGGMCKASCDDNERGAFGLGCPETEGSNKVFCCTPES